MTFADKPPHTEKNIISQMYFHAKICVVMHYNIVQKGIVEKQRNRLFIFYYFQRESVL